MTTRRGLRIGATLLLLGVAAFLVQDVVLPEKGESRAAAPTPLLVEASARPAESASTSVDAESAVAPIDRVAFEGKSESSPAEAFGTLEARFVWSDDETPAANLPFVVISRGVDPTTARDEKRTDAEGRLETMRLPAGDTVLRSTLLLSSYHLDIVPGATTKDEFRVPRGVGVDIQVVDADGRAVSGAKVCVVDRGRGVGVVRGVSDGNGACRIEPAYHGVVVGARLSGFEPSLGEEISQYPAPTRSATLILSRGGGGATGLVRDAKGRPVAGAFATFGDFQRTRPADGDDRVVFAPPPAEFPTDDQGRLHAVELQSGALSVVVRAPGFPDWRGTIDVPRFGEAFLDVVLAEAATLRGVVRDSEGAPAAGVAITASAVVSGEAPEGADGRASDSNRGRGNAPTTRSDRDGRFELRGLRVGSFELRATSADRGSARLVVETKADDATEVALDLDAGRLIRGKLLCRGGEKPYFGSVAAFRDRVPVDPSRGSGRMTAPDGRFAFEVEGDAPVLLVVRSHAGEVLHRRPGAIPGGAPLEIVVDTDAPDAGIKGRLVGFDAEELSKSTMSALATTKSFGRFGAIRADGSFEIGELEPGRWVPTVSGREGRELREYPAVDLRPGEVKDLGELRKAKDGALRAVATTPSGDVATQWAFIVEHRRGGNVLDSGLGPEFSRSLPPGDYVLRLSDTVNGGSEIRRRVTIEEGRETFVSITIGPEANPMTRLELRAAAVGVEGASNVRASFAFMDADGFEIARYSAKVNQPVLIDLPPGRYRVDVSDDTGASSETFIDVPAPSAEPPKFEFRLP